MTTTRSSNLEFCLHTLLGDAASGWETSAFCEGAIAVRGSLSRLAALVDIPQLRSAAALIAAWDGASDTALASSAKLQCAIPPTRDQMQILFESDFDLELYGLERFLPALRPLCRVLEDDLGLRLGRVSTHAFLTFQGGHQWPCSRLERSFSFNCQLQGTRAWRIDRLNPVRGNGKRVRTHDGGPASVTTTACESFVAQPGSVVVLPPNAIHETWAETASLAIAFAVDSPDTVARLVSARVREHFQTVDELRAPRLGAHHVSWTSEVSLVAAELRGIARSIERDGASWWSRERAQVRLCPGLSVEAVTKTAVTVRSASDMRTLALDTTSVALLCWASMREAFDARDVVRELIGIDPVAADECIQRLLYSGLLEKAP